MHEHEVRAFLVEKLEELVRAERRLLHALGCTEAAVRLRAGLDLLELYLRVRAALARLDVLALYHAVDAAVEVERHAHAHLVACCNAFEQRATSTALHPRALVSASKQQKYRRFKLLQALKG